jgi:putative lipoic acid-binding regulatory protein
MDKEKSEAFYNRLRVQLIESTPWPSVYLYKFIVPTAVDKINRIHEIFDNTGAVIESKKSKTGKYTSLSITVGLEGPDAVIRIYKEVGAIKGVISL